MLSHENLLIHMRSVENQLVEVSMVRIDSDQQQQTMIQNNVYVYKTCEGSANLNIEY